MGDERYEERILWTENKWYTATAGPGRKRAERRSERQIVDTLNRLEGVEKMIRPEESRASDLQNFVGFEELPSRPRQMMGKSEQERTSHLSGIIEQEPDRSSTT
jgi:hypothetical protein